MENIVGLLRSELDRVKLAWFDVETAHSEFVSFLHIYDFLSKLETLDSDKQKLFIGFEKATAKYRTKMTENKLTPKDIEAFQLEQKEYLREMARLDGRMACDQYFGRIRSSLGAFIEVVETRPLFPSLRDVPNLSDLDARFFVQQWRDSLRQRAIRVKSLIDQWYSHYSNATRMIDLLPGSKVLVEERRKVLIADAVYTSSVIISQNTQFLEHHNEALIEKMIEVLRVILEDIRFERERQRREKQRRGTGGEDDLVGRG